jgi:hypothetical protein
MEESIRISEGEHFGSGRNKINTCEGKESILTIYKSFMPF